MNRAFCRFLGLQAEELRGRGFGTAIHPEARRAWDTAWADLKAGADGGRLHALRFLRRDGATIWGLSGLFMLRTGDCEEARIVVQVQDTTESKQNEAKLQEQQALLIQGAEMANLGHWVWDETLDRCIYCSDSLARMNGVTPEQYLAGFATMADLLGHVHPDDRARYAEVIAEAREQARSYDLEYRVLGAGGHDRYFRERGEPVLGEDGKLVTTLGTLQDVSDYKHSEAALREARDRLELVVAQRTAAFQRANEALRDSDVRLKAFIDHSPTLISLKEPGGRYLMVNRTSQQLYGIDPEEAVGKRAGDVMPEAVAAQVDEMDREVLETGEARQREMRAPRDGCLRTYDVTKFPIREDSGEVLCIGTVVIDITEKKQAEEALRASEAQLRQAQSIARIGVFIWDDVDDRPIQYSPELAALFGVSEEELLAERSSHRSILGHLVPEDREHYDRVVAQAGRDLTAYAVEYRMRDGLGRIRHWRETGEPVVDERGRLLRTFGTVQDITGIRHTEEALRESNERFRSLVDSSPTAIFLKDPQGRFLRVNRRFETWYGHSESEVVGKTSWDLYPQAYAQLYVDMDRQVLERGEICERECPVPFADGRDRLTLVTKFPVREPDGRISSIGTINTDLSDRQQAQQRLRESEQRLSLAIQLSKLGHWIWDAASERCLFCSQEHAQLHDLTAERFMERVAAPGKRFAMVHPDDRARVESRFAALRAGERIELEYRVVTRGQSLRHVREIAEALAGPDGVTIQEHGVTLDITEQKLAEDRLYQAQKMEAVGQLTGGVAHDFNNLLAILQGNAELLSEEFGSGRPEVEEILDATLRGAALTQRLLAYSRRQPLHPLPVHLGRLVIGMAPILERTLGEAIEVHTRVPDGLWIVTADGGQVENALLNLAINARDAMAEGGRLTVDCRNQTLDSDFATRHPEASPGDHVVLSVSDSGSGMSPDVLAHAFEPFFTTKEMGHGSGLGLSMVYGFAKQSGGYAAIDSEEGRGTTVRLFLPRSNAVLEESDERSIDGEVPRGRNEMILLLEDNAAVRALDRRVLSGLGYRVLEAANARQAGSLMDLGAVDLLLSDVILPGGVSGPQFAEQARRRDPALKVVFMSGFPAGLGGPGGLIGPDQILLNKPFRRQELARALRRALGP